VPGRDETLRRVDPAAVRARYGLPDDYLLHVGTLQPRKNIVRLIEAYQSSVQGSQSRVSLVLAGKAGWLSQPIVTKAREAGARLLEIFEVGIGIGGHQVTIEVQGGGRPQ